MTLEYGKSRLLVPALLAASIGLIGCGGGGSDGNGGGSGGNTASGVTVAPQNFNFGTITEGNENHVLPREFVIRNQGTRSYNIATIRLRQGDHPAFDLNHSGGKNPCENRSFDLAPGDSCTVEVDFGPTEFDTFGASLFVETNDPKTSTVGGTLAGLAGTYEKIKSIHVVVNQVNACALPGPQAFVSVTDQARFPIRNLDKDNFILEGLDPIDVRQVGENAAYIPLSLSIAMDYSGSITDFPDVVDNMEAGAKLLVNQMKANDNADIIKYADDVEFMTTKFTSDKDILKAAIEASPGLDRDTAFYAATEEAIKRFGTAGGTNDRKAVIALTDGEDTFVDDTEEALEAALGNAIDQALGVDIPVFTIGFGPFIREKELEELADGTGGLFYQPASDANLQQALLKAALLLFEYQYVIDFNLPVSYDRDSLDVTLTFEDSEPRFKDVEQLYSGTKAIPACP